MARRRAAAREQQLAFLRENGCEQVQGYLFREPVPAGQLDNILKYATITPA